jgi:RNA polymerase sigma factor (sigma-70 family)
MEMETQTLEQPTDRRTAERDTAANARLYKSIPGRVDYIPNPEYLCAGAEEELFGSNAQTILAPQWRPSPKLEDGQDDVEPLQTRAANLSRQDEALLFKRYNCARYHLSKLMEKQTRCFAGNRVPEILMWHRRGLENRIALTEANMALVVAMAKRTKGNSMDFGELVSEGNIVLLRAVDKFDFSRGFRFSTYACTAILRAFSRLAAVDGTRRKRFPTNSELERDLGDESEGQHAYQRELELKDLRVEMILNRAGLTDVEQTVLGARFALVGRDHVHTLQEAGGLVGLTGEGVRQVQNRALAKLRLALEHTFIPATTSPGKTGGALGNLTAPISGRMDLEVLAVAECGS